MKRIQLKALFILIPSFFFSLFSFSQLTKWTPLNSGLNGGNITVILQVKNLLFAGTNNDGIYISSDNGINWTASNTGLSYPGAITSLVTDGSNLYASIYGGPNELYISSDNGASWKVLNSQIHGVTSLQFMGSKLFAGTANGVFFFQ
jgi:ligand-binding sensor domain-containing protein